MKSFIQFAFTLAFLLTAGSLHAAGPIGLNDPKTPGPILPEEGTSIVVDFGQIDKNQASMSGFLSSISGDVPINRQIASVKPRLIRGDAATVLVVDGKNSAGARYGLMKELGARYTLVVSNLWGYPVRNFRDKGAPAQNLNAFRTMVSDLTKKVRDQNLGKSVIFDIWNEPNGKRFAPGTEADHLQVYLAAERTIHAILPNALISGPSLTGYDPERIGRFLDFCLSAGCEVNVLNWHELLSVTSLPKDPGTDIAEVADHIKEMRQTYFNNPRYAALKLQRIHINEYLGRKDQYRPGEIIAYLSALERGGADAAAKTCWERIQDQKELSNCFNGSLDGLYGPDGKGKLAPWWVYKTYTANVGNRAASASGDPRFAVLAGMNENAKAEAQILIGHTRLADLKNPAPAQVKIDLNNLDKVVTPNPQNKVHVLAKRIPDAEEETVSTLEVVFDEDVTIGNNGVVSISLGKLPVHQALILSVFAAK